MKNELITIVIPCFLQSKLLPQAINTCLKQSYQNLEIIVVDDGSPDDVAISIEPFIDTIKLIRQKNLGLSAARNAGLAAAKGKYIKFLDADDWLLPSCIELQYNSIKNLKKHFSIIGYSFFYYGYKKPEEKIYPNFGKLKYRLCRLNTGPPHTFLFPKDILKKIGGFDTSSRVKGGHEDYDLICRLVLEGYDSVVLHKIGCVYRKTPGSMSTNLVGMKESRGKVWSYYCYKLLERKCDAELLVHIFDGYSVRVESGDIRYEFLDIIQKILFKLHMQKECISNNSAIVIGKAIIKLRKEIPKPQSTQEQLKRRMCIEMLDELTEICIDVYPDMPFAKSSYVSTLGFLARSHLWINRGNGFRKKITAMQQVKLNRTFNKIFFKVLRQIHLIIAKTDLPL